MATFVKNAPVSRTQPRYRDVSVWVGEVTLVGANPTPVTTPFKSVLGAQVTMKRTAAAATGAANAQHVTCDYSATSGVVNVYAWGSTATADTAEVASTNSSVVVSVVAFGVM